MPYARLATSTVTTENDDSDSGGFMLATYRQSRRPPPRYPFRPSPSDALVLLTLTTKINGSAFVYKRTYTLAVHVRTLLSHATSESSVPHVSNVAVPWDAWGPPVTRCFDGLPGPSSAVAGQRWFERGIIRDFCPRRAVRATGAGGTAQPRSTLLAGRVFMRDVEGTLPYSEISLAEYDDTLMEDVLIDSERVISFVDGTSTGSVSDL